MRRLGFAAAMLVLAGVLGCAETVRLGEGRGHPTHYEPPDTPGRVQGVGLESQDIISMTDRMLRDILASPVIINSSELPPRIVVDSEYFSNASATVIDKNLLTDRLRTHLNRAADGKVIFIARHHADMVEKERILEVDEVVSGGTKGETKAAVGFDYRLGGRIMSLDAIDSRSGARSRYHQITFELVERGSGVIVWSDSYELRKSAQDDIVYR